MANVYLVCARVGGPIDSINRPVMRSVWPAPAGLQTQVPHFTSNVFLISV